jgi:hypothetical protein
MKEEFLHYLWKYSLYDPDCLIDTDGNRIIVIHPGMYNRDAGPDFFNARISTGDMEWAGNVEVHLRASHFDTHGHNTDHAFDNVILHVVAEDDKAVFNARGERLQNVVLHYDPVYFEKYEALVNNPSTIACQTGINIIDIFYIRHWLNSLLIERLMKKSEAILKIYSETGNDWDETFYRMLSRYFGFRVNTEPFEMLATALPFRIIRKHADNRFQIEALLFGTAGMLDEGLFRDALSDTYYRDLIKEYKILSVKYSLRSIPGWIWKFNRLRPANFPTVRISQLSSMISVAGGLFSRIMEATNIEDLRELFKAEASTYWDEHYIFGNKSRNMQKKTGNQAGDIFLINAVIPLIFVYGRFTGNNALPERALSFYEDLPPETNSVISDWKKSGIDSESAFYTQALLQLTNEYCRKRRCLECQIGCKLISSGNKLMNQSELIMDPEISLSETHPKC